MRVCRFCGIGIGVLNSPPKSARAGCVCKVCNKYHARERALKYYHESNGKALQVKEPDKKICKVCGKTFWTSYKQKIMCSAECAKIRKNKQDEEYRRKEKECLIN